MFYAFDLIHSLSVTEIRTKNIKMLSDGAAEENSHREQSETLKLQTQWECSWFTFDSF